MNKTNVQRNFKDTVFRMLFQEKENLLGLYNALNKTSYTDVGNLEITTLENAVYMNYKNDISFVFDFELLLYEHRSTYNPNMPLRDLFYVNRVLQGRIGDKNLYSGKLVRIPAPRFVVFYNGTEACPEQQMLRLSDAFEKKQEQAVDHCIRSGILSDFLSKNRAEAIAVSIFEYDEEKHMQSERKEWREIGYTEGRESGLAEGLEKGHARGHQEGENRALQLIQKLTEAERTEEMNRALSDPAYREQLYREYGL